MIIITFNDNDYRNRPDCPAKANEWGKRYQFWSCADVDIMPPNNFAQVLSSGSSTGASYFKSMTSTMDPKSIILLLVFSSPSLSPRPAVVMAEPSAEDVAATETTTETFVNTR